jgi:protein-L-isoaspartate(D-aspartate) O-methyltransferase
MEPDFSQQRVKMVDGQVRTTDVTDQRLLAALLEIPREEFVEPKDRPLAYVDVDLRLSAGDEGAGARYLMRASPFAKLVQAAKVTPSDFVLDVGCATGYSSAVLSRLAGSVVGLEADAGLAERASDTLSRLGFDNVAVVTGPFSEGYAAEAPYDVIFVGGAVETPVDGLFPQLRPGGRLVVVEGLGNAGRAKLYLNADDTVSGRSLFNAAIRPLPGFQPAYTFQF